MYIQSSFGIPGGLVPGALWISKSEDAPDPFIKWQPMHIHRMF